MTTSTADINSNTTLKMQIKNITKTNDMRTINILTLALTLTLFFGCKENSDTAEGPSGDTATSNVEESEGHN